MSVYVTVNAKNPMCFRERTIFADREQIKKQERERRKRLRTEQVRQQARDFSSNVLERTKELLRKELGQLEKNENSELKRMHEQKIMDIQQKYQEDMEDIGLAHDAALAQPNVEIITEVKQHENRVAAAERGKDAIQRLKMASKANPAQAKRERLRQVRDIENIRSAMVASIPKHFMVSTQVTQNNPDTGTSTSSGSSSSASPDANNDDPDAIIHYVSPKKRKSKKLVGRKSPGKVTVKTHGKSFSQAHSHKVKTPQRVVVEVHRDDVPSRYVIDSQNEQHRAMNVDTNQDAVIFTSDNQHTSGDEVEIRNVKSKVSSNLDGQYLEYNPNDYRQRTSGGSASSSSSSDDSSYFSDAAVAAVPNNTPIISQNSSEKYTRNQKVVKDIKDGIPKKKTVQQKDSKGLVERIDLRNDLNAEDRARLIAEQELIAKNLGNESKQSLIQDKRGAEAILREKIRRGYTNLMKNLDDLSREERKLKAAQVQESRCRQRDFADQTRRKEFYDVRQKMMNKAYDAAVCADDEVQVEELPERIITLPRSEVVTHKCPGTSRWESPPFSHEVVDEENELTRDEQILEMLKKVEHQKKLLLKEFGTSLPNDVLSASMRPLFNESKREKPESIRRSNEVEHRPSPEIKVINLSRSSGDKKGKLGKKKKDLSDKSEIAVQTSQINEPAEDKSIQVGLSNNVKHITIPRISKDSNGLEYVEPIVTIITHGEVSSNESLGRNIVINVGNGAIQGRKRLEQRLDISSQKTSPRTKARSLPSSSPVKGISTNTATSTSAPTSRAGSPVKLQDSTDSTGSHVTGKITRKLTKRSPRKVHGAKKKSPESSARQTSDGTGRNYVMEYSPDTQGPSTSKYVPVKRQISYTDNSEASSSYASLSGVKPNSSQKSNIESVILQLLDSSLSDSVRKLPKDISPVSTPETPSSHIINVPSNIANYKRFTRILSYADVNKSGKQEKSTTSFIKHEEGYRPIDQDTDSTQQSSNIEPEANCSCRNPTCNVINAKVNEIMRRRHSILSQESLTINKYDNLQMMCEENINSLTNLLERIRNEKDVDQSIVTQSTETSMRRISPSRQQESVLTCYKKLNENIETINQHLLKTYTEYEKIDVNQKLSPNLSSIIEEQRSKRLPSPKNVEYYEQSPRAKPRILKDEKVNINLKRFKTPGSQPSTSDRSKDDHLVEKLSHEILEESKKVEKYKLLEDESFQDETILRELPTTSTGRSTGIATSSPKDLEEKARDLEILASVHKSPKRAEDNFERILDETPKVPQEQRVKYRIDGRLVRPELSTIVEQDTPDTGKSFGSVRTPSSKSQRIFMNDVLFKNTVSKSITNVPNTNIPILSNIGEASTQDQKIERPNVNEQTLKPLDKPNSKFVPYENHVNGNDKQLVVSPKNFYGINGEDLKIDESIKSLDSFLIHCRSRNVEFKSDKITSSSSSSFSGFSGISDILSTPTSDTIASPPEKMEDYLMGLGLAWLIPIARKTREASALSSSSSSDITIAMTKRTKSPIKKLNNNPTLALPGFSDVSSISIREANKSTEKTVLMKGRTSTPNISNFHYTSEKSSVITTSTSGGMSLPDQSDSIIATNLSLYLKT